MILEPFITPFISLFFLGLVLMFFAIGVGAFLFWLWMFVDCLQREFISQDPNTANFKLLWVLVLLFAGFIGALLYFILVKKTFNFQRVAIEKIE